MLTLLIAVLSALFDPVTAAHLAADIVGEPTMAEALVRICHRESVGPPGHRPGTCRAPKVHRGDAWASRRVWERAVAHGKLRPWCQPYDGGGWSTRGSWGLMAAYNVHRLGPCVPKWALDVPLFSALAAARLLRDHCARPPPGSRTKSGKLRRSKHPATIRWATKGLDVDACSWYREKRTSRDL